MGHLLNIGSGQRPFKAPWVNIDKQARWNPDIIWDVGNPLDLCPLTEECASVICLHHVLEHFGCNEGNHLLSKCHQLLKERGSILVFVPDMWELASMWMTGRLTTQLYMTNMYGAYMGNEADRHKWGYTTDSLRDTLAQVGFRHIERFNWRDVQGADIARDRWILGLEAIK